MHCRHRLGCTDDGGSPLMNEYASLSHTTRPSAALTTQGVSAPMNPPSASAKSVVSSSGSPRLWRLCSTRPTLPSIPRRGNRNTRSASHQQTSAEARRAALACKRILGEFDTHGSVKLHTAKAVCEVPVDHTTAKEHE